MGGRRRSCAGRMVAKAAVALSSFFMGEIAAFCQKATGEAHPHCDFAAEATSLLELCAAGTRNCRETSLRGAKPGLD